MTENLEIKEWTEKADFDLKKYPESSPYIGLYEKKLSDGDAAGREYHVYTPTTYHLWISVVLVFCPEGKSGGEYAKNSPWIELAEKNSFAVVFASAKDGKRWNVEDYEDDCRYISGIIDELLGGMTINFGNDHMYAAGYGENAGTMGAINAIIHQGQWAGYVSVGKVNISSEELDNLGNRLAFVYEEAPDVTIPGFYNKDMLLPVWLMEQEKDSPVLNYFLKADHTESECVCNEYARIFWQNRDSLNRSSNARERVRVWVSNEEAKELMTGGRLEQVIWEKFFEPVYRAPNIPGGSFHSMRPHKKMKLEKHEFECNGFKREYYVYLPAGYRGEKLPVVVQTHGFAGSALQMLYYNEMWEVADKRRFILVMTQSTRGHITESRPAQWATGLLGNIDVTVQTTIEDEIAYFERVYDEVTSQYSADKGRVYLTGHSNGAAMTSVITDRLGTKITAASGIGFGCIHAENYQDLEAVKSADKVPYLLGMGEYDLASVDIDGYESVSTDEVEPFFEVNKNTWDGMNYWGVRYRLKRNGINPKTEDFSERDTGVFRLREYYDSNKIPLVYFLTYALACHCYDLTIAYAVWDEFFCNYRRDADGKLYYRGIEIK